MIHVGWLHQLVAETQDLRSGTHVSVALYRREAPLHANFLDDQRCVLRFPSHVVVVLLAHPLDVLGLRTDQFALKLLVPVNLAVLSRHCFILLRDVLLRLKTLHLLNLNGLML